MTERYVMIDWDFEFGDRGTHSGNYLDKLNYLKNGVNGLGVTFNAQLTANEDSEAIKTVVEALRDEVEGFRDEAEAIALGEIQGTNLDVAGVKINGVPVVTEARTINGLSLNRNIILRYDDVGALALGGTAVNALKLDGNLPSFFATKEAVDGKLGTDDSAYNSTRFGTEFPSYYATAASVNAINAILASDETTLNELQEIVEYIQINRGDLDALGIGSIAGLQYALDAKLSKTGTAANSDKLGNKPASAYMGAVSDGSYWGLAPNGSTASYVRAPINGILPYMSGGNGSLGTSSWPWASTYSSTFYEGGVALSAKYLGKTAVAANTSLFLGYSGSTGIVANTFALRDSAADINARLFKSNYANQSTINGAMAFRTNNSSDNYIRFCSSKSAIRAWLDVNQKVAAVSYVNVNTTVSSATYYPMVFHSGSSLYSPKGGKLKVQPLTGNVRSLGNLEGLYTSDETLKRKITEIINPLYWIRKTRTATYEKLNLEDNQYYPETGFIAQDLLKYLKVVIKRNPAGHLTIVQGGYELIAYAFSGIKKLDVKVIKLQLQTRLLKRENQKLVKRLENLERVIFNGRT